MRTQSARSHPRRHRVCGEQRDRARLACLLGEPAREPGAAQLLLHRQAVARLQLERGRTVRRASRRAARARTRAPRRRSPRRTCAPTGRCPVAAVQLTVGDAAQARLELVGAPADERQVRVLVDEARHEAPAVGVAERRLPRKAVGGARVTIVPSSSQATPTPALGRLVADLDRRAGAARRRHRRGHDRTPRHRRSLRVHRLAFAPPPTLDIRAGRTRDRAAGSPRGSVDRAARLGAPGRLDARRRPGDGRVRAARRRRRPARRAHAPLRRAGVHRADGGGRVGPAARLDIRHGSIVAGTGTWLLDPIEGGPGSRGARTSASPCRSSASWRRPSTAR